MKLLLIGFSLVGTLLVAMEEASNRTIKLVILNGTSCAGKTSLARALTEELSSNMGIYTVVHMSFDDIFVATVLNPDYIEQQKAYFERVKQVAFYEDPCKKPSQQMMECYFTVFYHQILDRMRQGLCVIADHCFTTNESFLDFLDIFKEYGDQIALIKLFCSDEAALSRLKRRNRSGDEMQKRALWAFKQHYDRSEKGKYQIIYGNKEYDYELENSDISPEEGSKQIFQEFFVKNHRSHAFNENRELRKDDLDRRFNT